MDEELKKAVALVTREIEDRIDEAYQHYWSEITGPEKVIAGEIWMDLTKLLAHFRSEFYR